MLSNKPAGLFLLAWVAILLSSCASAGLSLEQAAETAHDIAATNVVLTLTALPTSTAIPTETPQPSATPSPDPSETATLASSTTPPLTPTFAPTWTPYGRLQPTEFGTAQADKDDKNAPLLLENKSGEDILFVLLSPIYQEYQFSKSMTIILPEGQYTYRVWIGNSSPMNGSFSITNGDKHILTFYVDKVHFSTP